jgi:hypothetical protein
VFWVISVYFNIRNTLPKYGIFLLGHPVYATFFDANLEYRRANYQEGFLVKVWEGEISDLWGCIVVERMLCDEV